MAASLGAFYRRIPVGHVEAGLRTEDKWQPFPEEINRRITGVVADLHFAPTEWAAGNLRREGVPNERMVVTGNTVIDAIHQVSKLPYDPTGTPLARLPFGEKRLIVVTAHRRENFGRGIG
jgi:UDP-N-acetylglucosamine 2-epimerase (non-hydrolysing)